jgi:hypothetical protein
MFSKFICLLGSLEFNIIPSPLLGFSLVGEPLCDIKLILSPTKFIVVKSSLSPPKPLPA